MKIFSIETYTTHVDFKDYMYVIPMLLGTTTLSSYMTLNLAVTSKVFNSEFLINGFQVIVMSHSTCAHKLLRCHSCHSCDTFRLM